MYECAPMASTHVNEVLNTLIDIVKNASINHQSNNNEKNSSLVIVDINELSLKLLSSQKSLIKQRIQTKI